MRTETCFNKNWKFMLDDQQDYALPAFDDSMWKPLTLPHDWSNDYAPEKDAPSGGGGGYGVCGIGWYRKHFTIQKTAPDERVFLRFDGIYMNSEIFLNGVKIGGHGYGYTSFFAELTEQLVSGENILAVRVNDSQLPNSRWYAGAGIYRDVFLICTSDIHFDEFGVRALTNGLYPAQDQAGLDIRALVKNESQEDADIGVIHELLDADDKSVSVSGIALHLPAGTVSECMVRPTIDHPILWTDRKPYLYTLVSRITVNGKIVDEVRSRTGIRTATFDTNQGFLLNGERVKIKGMCVHHDCGVTGAVGYRDSWERRLRKLRDMGCNGIRCSHNPPTPVLLDLCDELGFLVMDEIFDEWLLAKNKTDNYYSEHLAYGSSMFFTQDAEKDLTAMLRRDFNHPSVIIWSIGNEIPEQSSKDGVRLLHFLQDICHREDPSRMVTSACDNIVAVEPIRTFREFENALDVVGYNYVGRWRERAETYYDEDRAEFPERRFIGTENPSAGGVRGDYHLLKPDEPHEGFFRMRDYTMLTLHHEPLWRYTASRDFVAGDYLWTGIDYLGETRWPSRGASCGPLDSAGFEKDSYYYFRSIWNTDDVTLHLVPHWNFPGEEGQYRPVICYTNCTEVRLYLNGKYIGTRGYECPRYGATMSWLDGWDKHPTTNDLHLSWDVLYEPGILRAEGYIGGKLAAVEEVRTTGRPAKLLAVPDKVVTAPDTLFQIELSTEDLDGLFVPDASENVHIEVSGPVRFIGMDAGDMKDLSLFSTPERRMLAGRLLAVLMAEAPGEVTVRFTTDSGLETELSLIIQ